MKVRDLEKQSDDELEEENKTEPLSQCRYCLEVDSIRDLRCLCACRGSVRYVHEGCILKWISYKMKNDRIKTNQIVNCEICKYPMRMWFEEPAWFPFILSTRGFWKMLLDLTFTIMGMFWYVREFKLRRKRSFIISFVKGAYMSITCGLIGLNFTLDQAFFRIPLRKFSPRSRTKDLVSLARLVTYIAIMVRWLRHLYRITYRSFREMSAERLRHAKWSFGSRKAIEKWEC